MSLRRSSSLTVCCGGAHDESAGPVLAFAVDDALQPLALFLGADLARDADVVHGRHVDQEAAGQRDMAGDARALLADGLLGDLDQDSWPSFSRSLICGRGMRKLRRPRGPPPPPPFWKRPRPPRRLSRPPRRARSGATRGEYPLGPRTSARPSPFSSRLIADVVALSFVVRCPQHRHRAPCSAGRPGGL